MDVTPSCVKCGTSRTYDREGKPLLIRDRRDRDGLMRKLCVTCGLMEEVAGVAKRKRLVEERLRRDGVLPPATPNVPSDDLTEEDEIRLHGLGITWKK